MGPAWGTRCLVLNAIKFSTENSPVREDCERPRSGARLDQPGTCSWLWSRINGTIACTTGKLISADEVGYAMSWAERHRLRSSTHAEQSNGQLRVKHSRTDCALRMMLPSAQSLYMQGCNVPVTMITSPLGVNRSTGRRILRTK